MIKSELQIAVGLETANRELLKKLTKRMTPEDFTASVRFLKENDILSRAFILLRPPFLSESEGIIWAQRSLDFAFTSGVECCVVIPVRAGNGAMDHLMDMGYFTPPDIHSLEKVLEYGIQLKAGRVFADTWDLALFSKCSHCLDERIKRLNKMNLCQSLTSPVKCKCDNE